MLHQEEEARATDANLSFLSFREGSNEPEGKKSPSTPVATKEMAPESIADGRMLIPLCQIVSLETLEILLNMGASFWTDH
jgi:hypothetical protein